VPNWRLVLEYDGTHFEGWQRQAGATRTVQGTLEAALAQVTGVAAGVHGAGRTDAGVHAEGQVANVRLETRLAPAELLRALDAVLPRDVVVRSLAVAPDAFHARRDALSKLYTYRLWTAPVRSPLRERTALWVPAPHDLDAMRRAAAALVGEHDFASFQAAGAPKRSTLRRMDRLEIAGVWGGEVAVHAEASGFLRHMVRNLIGTLLEVGRGRRSPDSMPALLAARDRGRAGPTAAPHGLTLVRVHYGDFSADSEGLAAPPG
jgi:tRNA pseudouridine38-40 synthase